MNYTIFTREQVTPRLKSVAGPFSGARVVLNPGDPPAYPPGAAVFYAPPQLDIYSDDPAARRVLLADPAGVAALEQILAAFPLILAAKYQRLWEAASAWERQNISGVGLSILSLGVAQGKPKAMAVAQWSNDLWMGLYYPRKALISLETEPDCDFSAAGDMPHSVPELSAEIWT